MPIIRIINEGWVEITNPLSQEIFYANPGTGEASWEKPLDADLMQKDPDNEWWELWDNNYNFPYYYHPATGKTEWIVPRMGCIIALTKVQNSSIGRRITASISSNNLYLTAQQQQIKKNLNSGIPSGSSSKGASSMIDRRLPETEDEYYDCQEPLDAERNKLNISVTVESSIKNLPKVKTQTTENSSESEQSSPSEKSPKRDCYFINNGKLYSQDLVRHPLESLRITSESSTRPSSALMASKSDGDLPSMISAGMVIVQSINKKPSSSSLKSPDPSSKLLNDSVFLQTKGQLSLELYRNQYSPTDSHDTPAVNYKPPINREPWQNFINRKLKGDGKVGDFKNSDSNSASNTHKEETGGEILLNTARQYFNTHKKGVFRRKIPVEKMMLFQKGKIRQPLMVLNPQIKKDAIKCFKSIQRIMGDRSMKRGPHRSDLSVVSHTSRSSSSTLPSSTLRLLEEIQWLLNKGILNNDLRDEIYMQNLKQLTGNFNGNSVRRGWELLCVLAITFPPSKKLEPYLTHFVKEQFTRQENQVDVYSKHVFSRLERTYKKGSRGKVLTLMEIKREMEAPFNPSIFGESLEFIMKLQEKTNPGLDVPGALPFLAHSILELKGKITEGIFRIPGDADQITKLRLRIENNDFDIVGITDPNVPASLLKFWLRDLTDPLVPNEFYEQCIRNSEDIDTLVEIIEQFPKINRRVIIFIVRFLQIFSTQDVINETKMDINNLSMVFAPNFLRCPTDSLTAVFSNAKFEQLVVRNLLTNFRPSDIDDDGRFGFRFEDSWD